MKIKFGIDQLDRVSIDIKKLIDKNLVLMSGEMGMGKTTIIKSILNSMDVLDNISSPTFSIINEYRTNKNKVIYHMDLFRIKDIGELDQLGIFEYIDSGNLCFIEWPNLIEDIVDLEFNKFNITCEGLDRIIEKIKWAL